MAGIKQNNPNGNLDVLLLFLSANLNLYQMSAGERMKHFDGRSPPPPPRPVQVRG